MDNRIFDAIIDAACSYYERKHPNEETLILWRQKASGIPNEAAKYIQEHITDADAYPRNIPAAMWALFHAWQAANPDKKATQAFFACPDCIDGIIWASKPNESGRKYRYIFRCCRCRQNHVQAYPKAYKADLIQRGYEITTPQGWKVSSQEKTKTRENFKRIGATPF